MKKVLVYSIKPEHMLNILNGNKTIEIRKRDLPQWVKEVLAQGEVVDGYGYCTKGGKRLAYEKQPKHPYYMLSNSDGVNSGNGKVVVKFEVSGVNKIIMAMTKVDVENYVMLDDINYIPKNHYTDNVNYDEIPLDKMCLDYNQLLDYGNGADLYAHHFTNITPIKPMELGEFYRMIDGLDEDGGFLLNTLKDGECVSIPQLKQKYLIKQPPQSFMTAWVMEVVE